MGPGADWWQGPGLQGREAGPGRAAGSHSSLGTTPRPALVRHTACNNTTRIYKNKVQSIVQYHSFAIVQRK